MNPMKHVPSRLITAAAVLLSLLIVPCAFADGDDDGGGVAGKLLAALDQNVKPVKSLSLRSESWISGMGGGGIDELMEVVQCTLDLKRNQWSIDYIVPAAGTLEGTRNKALKARNMSPYPAYVLDPKRYLGGYSLTVQNGPGANEVTLTGRLKAGMNYPKIVVIADKNLNVVTSLEQYGSDGALNVQEWVYGWTNVSGVLLPTTWERFVYGTSWSGYYMINYSDIQVSTNGKK